MSADGQGLAGLTVSLTGGPDNVSETAMTDSSGQVAFARLRAGPWAAAAISRPLQWGPSETMA